MAKSIKETPALYGEDSIRFSEKLKENETRRVSSEESKRVTANYNKVKLVAKD